MYFCVHAFTAKYVSQSDNGADTYKSPKYSIEITQRSPDIETQFLVSKFLSGAGVPTHEEVNFFQNPGIKVTGNEFSAENFDVELPQFSYSNHSKFGFDQLGLVFSSKGSAILQSIAG